MGRITSSIGLVTGLDIGKTVDQLISLQSRPREQLATQNDTRDKQQLALSTLASQLVGLKLSVGKLRLPTLYDVRQAASSDSSTLGVTVTGKPALGSYEFTPLQLSQAQRLLSSGVADKTAALGGGQVSFQFGGFVDSDTSLDVLNGGAGVKAGQVRLTDRTGFSVQVDLRLARTLGDVVQAINTSGGGVRASVADGGLKLTDISGGSGNLRVDDVSGGTTAAGLGLAGVNVASSTVVGASLNRLFNELGLDQLNDGRGLRFDDLIDDLQVSFRDGSTARVDFQRKGTSPDLISATTASSGRPDAQLTFRAVSALPQLVGVQVKFEDDSTITKGKETVAYDDSTRTLTFRIDEGNTTAQNIVTALKRNTSVNKQFTASLTGNNAGTGLVVGLDAVTLDGPRSQLITAGNSAANGRLKISALTSTADLDGYQVVFQGGAAGAGQESVAVDNQAKTITVTVAQGQSTAANVVAALGASSDFTAKFQATTGSSIGSDGSGLIDLTDGGTTSGGTVIPAQNERSLGDLLATLNAAAPGKLSAAIAADGQRIVLSDLTSDQGGTFAVTDLNGSKVALDLGLTGTAAGGTLTGQRVLSGPATTLLSSLNGGKGLGSLGQVSVTDRSGATATVDLSQAETLEEVIDTLNAAGLGVRAQVNTARNGISLTDTTGATAANLVVADADATSSATKLRLAGSSASGTLNSGTLRRQTVSENTLLASLNGGDGVALSTLEIIDTRGRSQNLDLGQGGVATVGDVLREINGLGLDVQARINDAGDGIVLFDTAGATTAKLQVKEGKSSTAADLHLLGAATTVDLGGTPTQAIDGSHNFRVTLSATDSLDDLVAKLNAKNAGVAFSVLSDGSSVRPNRLSIVSQHSGRAGELQIDLSSLGLSLEQTAAAQDAVVALGAFGATGGQLVTSHSNTFSALVAGLTVQVQKTSTNPVVVSVTQDDTKLVSSVQDVVDRYNAIHDQVRTLSSRNGAKPGILAGSSALRQIESQLANIVSSRFSGKFQSTRTLGIGFVAPQIGSDGTLSADESEKAGRLEFDRTALENAFANDALAVQDFFGSASSTFAGRFDTAINRLAASDGAVLVQQITTLNRQITEGKNRLAVMDALLKQERDRLTNSFNQAELAISKLQDSQSVLSTLASLAGGSTTRNSSSSR